MRHRLLLLLLLLLLLTLLLLGPGTARAASDHWWFGGGIGLSFGAVDFIAIEPVVGYSATEEVSVGARLVYRYREDSRFTPSLSTNDYGGSLFVRYRFHPNVFLQAEYEYLSYEFQRMDGSKDRDNFDSLLGGVGYVQPIGRRSAVVVQALYIFNYDEVRSPYDDPWVIRAGVTFGF